MSNIVENDDSNLKDHKFIVDVMLIKLGRWLRILGYDCIIPNSLNKNEIDDEKLINLAIKEKRIFLTMDKRLAENKQNVNLVLIPSSLSTVKAQILFLLNNSIIDADRLDISELENRIKCSKCGGKLEIIKIDDLRGFLSDEEYDRIRLKYKEVWRCKNCNHIYWKGSHWNKIIQLIKDIKKELKLLNFV